MAQFYTLEEAARALGMSPEELQAKAQQREVRAFMDGGSWRFRVADVDELARRKGLGSDPELSLSDLDTEPPKESDSSGSDFDLSEFQLGVASPDVSGSSAAAGGGSENDLLLDDLSLPPESTTGSSSTIVGMGGQTTPMQSDVRLAPDFGDQGPSDSDITLVSDDPLLATSSEAIPVPHAGPGAKRPVPPIGSSGEIKAGHGEESDFELTPSSVIDALQPESGSDFELTPMDASSEFEAAAPKKASDSDVTGASPSSSGINLGRPNDSGINLGGPGGFDLDAAESIELAPLDESAIKPSPTPAAKAKPSQPAKKGMPQMSDTSIPLKSDQSNKGEKDIFDDTDFEVDAIDSSPEDRTAQLESASDFDLDEGEDASRVFSIDEDDVDQNAATALGPAAVDEFGEDSSDEVEEEVEPDWEEEGEAAAPAAAPARAGAAAPVLAASGAGAEWGGLWVGLLMVATLFTMLLAFVAMDVLRNLYAYREPGTTIASGLVKQIAGLMGG